MVETAQTTKRPDKGSRPYLTVACKIGVAWFDLRICEPKEVEQQSLTGSKTVTEFRPTGEVIRLHGTAYPRGEAPEGFPEKPQMIVACALTKVRRDLWEKYIGAFKPGKEPEFLRSGMVFAYESEDDIKAEATERKDQLSGLEPLKVTKSEIIDARMGKSSRGDVSKLEPDSARMTARQST